jgi:hypothetical protein
MNPLVIRIIKEDGATLQVISFAKLVSDQKFKMKGDKIFHREDPANADDMTRLINESRKIIAQSSLSQEVKELLAKKSDIDLQRTLRDVYINFLGIDKNNT